MKANMHKGYCKLQRTPGDPKLYHPEFIPWEAAEFTEFTAKLKLYPLRLLAMLLKKNAATDAELRKELGYANNKALAGTLSGISKGALSLDIEPQRVYNQRTSYKHGKPLRMYYIGPMFRKAAIDHDWPSETDLNPRQRESRTRFGRSKHSSLDRYD